VPRVVVFTDQPVLAEGFRRVLAPGGLFELGGVLSEPAELAEKLPALGAAVALLDEHAITGREVLAQAACANCHLVLWVEEVTIETVRHAFEVGMRGVISGRTAPDVFLAALARIARGELFFPELHCTPGELAGTSLGPREKELVTLIAQGLKNKEVATAMNLSEGTVKVYLSRLYRRLGVADRFELALFGLQAFFGHWAEKGAAARPVRRAVYPVPNEWQPLRPARR
jgi:DNA-binding NarL/FixJ family response regulator